MSLQKLSSEHGSAGRSRLGNSIIEMPVALWIILTMCFSLLILASLGLRFGFFWNAGREAAMQAAKCQTFEVDSAVGKSAVTTADAWAAKATTAFTGLTLQNVNVYILQTDVSSGTQTQGPNRKKLAVAADPAASIYDIQVELTGQVEPLIRYPSAGIFGNVPGLTGPIPCVVRSQYTAEVPQGLNK